jgi:carbamoyltransferase
MIVLGLHKDPWHNTCAAMIVNRGDGARFAYIAEERLDRVKDSRAFPEQAIAACMRELGVASVNDIDHVVVDYIANGSSWSADFINRPCRRDVFLADIPTERIHVVNHHLLHAYATYFSSPFRESTVLIVDGRGSDEETQSIFRARGTRIELVESTTAIGVGLLYAAVTQAIGFGNLQEGKTMGLAPYGQNIAKSIFNFHGEFDGIKTDYGRFCMPGSYGIAAKHAPIETFDDKARAAFEVQEECERALLHLARHAKKAAGLNNLCLSGGVALNSVANNAIRLAKLYDGVFINPAASDTGIALGAALYGYHMVAGMPKDYGDISPFLGPNYTSAQIAQAVAKYSGYSVIHDRTFEAATRLLLANRIVGCLQGRSEMGPRALGNRSILMSPMIAENKDILNARVKHREAFRPFAPAVLLERTQEFFEIDCESPYMLFICDVLPGKRHLVPAITHVDGTARLQTLTPDRNGRFYDIVKAFGAVSGVPVLLNTSFNVAGEPIVESPEDTIKCFLGTDIDALLIGDTLLLKPGIEAVLR